MRGWSSLFGKDRGTERYATGVFVATAEPSLTSTIVGHLPERFPNVTFTCLAPRSYGETVSFQGETLWFEDIKTNPLRWLISLRRRRFDICVAILDGGPSFRKWKIAAFFLNARRIWIYDENDDCLAVDRAQVWKLCRRSAMRRRPWPSFALLFFPIGFSYLLARTMWMISAARLHRTSSHAADTSAPRAEISK
jgi:hypothetical protein